MKRTATLLSVLAVTVLCFAAPAQAAPDSSAPATIAAGRDDCPQKYVCLWTDRNFTGAHRWQGQYDNETLPREIDNQASSSFNNGKKCTAYLWSDPYYEGVNRPLPLGSYLAYMNSDPGPSPVGSWEDVVSSVHWCKPR